YNGQLYVGRAFTSVTGPGGHYNRLCRFDASTNTWSAVGTWTATTPSAFSAGDVQVLTVYNGKLYVGGAFQNGGGINICDYLCRWDGSAWSAVGAWNTGSVSTVYALAVYNGQLYVGGNMTSAAGLNTGLDRFNGTTWSTVGGFATTGSLLVNALAVYCGELYVGGSFTNFNGVIDYLARWNDSAWNNVS